ncbi:hypothetical protein HDC33_000483 [Sporosarcina sp. JAI121]|nr:hypothetical protein [Sporosarcina sp. JAI121]
MQPVYIQFDKLNLTSKPTKDGKRYVGGWKITETGNQRFFYLLKTFSFSTFIICFLLNLFAPSTMLDVVRDIAILLTGLSFIARKERVVLFSILTIYFILPLLSSLSKMF